MGVHVPGISYGFHRALIEMDPDRLINVWDYK